MCLRHDGQTMRLADAAARKQEPVLRTQPNLRQRLSLRSIDGRFLPTHRPQVRRIYDRIL